MTPGRSSIPKVVGILMIVFASLGLLFTLLALTSAGTGSDYREMQSLPAFKTLTTVRGTRPDLPARISAAHAQASK